MSFLFCFFFVLDEEEEEEEEKEEMKVIMVGEEELKAQQEALEEEAENVRRGIASLFCFRNKRLQTGRFTLSGMVGNFENIMKMSETKVKQNFDRFFLEI